MDIEKLNYHYGSEADHFTFFRIPKILFSDKRFSKVSPEAKILYGLLLDRMSLSIKNGWLDEQNRVYIFYKVKEVMEIFSIGKEKAIKLFAELDIEKGCGLIRRIKQGFGGASIIYVMKFTYDHIDDQISEIDNSEESTVKIDGYEKQTSGGMGNADLLKSEKQTSGGSKTETQEVRKADPNNTNINNTESSDIEYSKSYPILSGNNGVISTDVFRKERNDYRELVLYNIDYLQLTDKYGIESIDGIVEIMLDVICSKKQTILVNCDEVPHNVVKSVFVKLRGDHIEYVLDCMRQNKTKIRNIKSYLITSLYNSYSTIDHYYRAEVNHDLSERGSSL